MPKIIIVMDENDLIKINAALKGNEELKELFNSSQKLTPGTTHYVTAAGDIR